MRNSVKIRLSFHECVKKPTTPNLTCRWNDFQQIGPAEFKRNTEQQQSNTHLYDVLFCSVKLDQKEWFLPIWHSVSRLRKVRFSNPIQCALIFTDIALEVVCTEHAREQGHGKPVTNQKSISLQLLLFSDQPCKSTNKLYTAETWQIAVKVTW